MSYEAVYVLLAPVNCYKAVEYTKLWKIENLSNKYLIYRNKSFQKSSADSHEDSDEEVDDYKILIRCHGSGFLGIIKLRGKFFSVILQSAWRKCIHL